MEFPFLRFELGELKQIPRHIQSDPELFFLLRGQVDFDLDGAVYHMRENDVIVCNPDQVHGAKENGDNLMFRLLVTQDFLLQESGELCPPLRCNSCMGETMRNALAYEQIRHHIRTMMSLLAQPDTAPRLEVKSALLQLISSLFQNFQDYDRAPERNAYSPRIQAVIEQMHLHYREEVSLQQIADATHISLHHLSRLFKMETGKSFTEYLNDFRLSGAVNDLLHSRESVIRIALNNGFSNVAGFNRRFAQVYGCTPAKYRATRALSPERPHSDYELIRSAHSDESLIKYLRRFEIKHIPAPQDSISCNIALHTPAVHTALPRHEHIISAGRIIQLLKVDIRRLLASLKQDLSPDYIHTTCLFDDGLYTYSYGSTYASYEYFSALDFLDELSIPPYLQLRLPSPGIDSVPPDQMAQRLSWFLAEMKAHFRHEFLLKWRFELFYTDLREDLTDYCTALVAVIRKFLPDASISLPVHCDADVSETCTAPFVRLLTRLAEAGFVPGRICYYTEPLPDIPTSSNEGYAGFRHILGRQLQQFARRMSDAGFQNLTVDLMRWNVLSGFTTSESNTFYRGAIFLDELFHLPPCTLGVSYWISTYVHESATGRETFDSIALFLISQIRRPIYFSLYLLAYLYPQVIQMQDNIYVTRKSESQLAILVMNPCYFSPRLSIDTTYTAQHTKNFVLHLSGIEGSWIIEHHKMDNLQTSIYEQWARMGFPEVSNPNVIRQITQSVRLEYAIYGETLSGSHSIRLSLDFNEAVVVLLRKDT